MRHAQTISQPCVVVIVEVLQLAQIDAITYAEAVKSQFVKLFPHDEKQVVSKAPYPTAE